MPAICHRNRADEATCSRDEDAHALIMRTSSRLSQNLMDALKKSHDAVSTRSLGE
jgi:hypothetical protein